MHKMPFHSKPEDFPPFSNPGARRIALQTAAAWKHLVSGTGRWDALGAWRSGAPQACTDGSGSHHRRGNAGGSLGPPCWVEVMELAGQQSLVFSI